MDLKFGVTVTGRHCPGADLIGYDRLSFLFWGADSAPSDCSEDVGLMGPRKSDADKVEGRDDGLENCGGVSRCVDRSTDIPGL